MLTSSVLKIRHAFFTREGGMSTGIYAGLNCGSGSNDDPQAVSKNRKQAQEALNAEHLCSLYQIHSPDVITVTEPWEQKNAPQADAMVTNKAGVMLGILTADCAPVLFADAEKKVVGAAHAGWKGAAGGVIEATIESMEALGAVRSNITASIGPCIHQPSYEVGEDFREKLLELDTANSQWFIPSINAGHYQFDLPHYVASRLKAAGITHIDILPHDTYMDERRFFSYRRATHSSEPDYGRQLSAIVL